MRSLGRSKLFSKIFWSFSLGSILPVVLLALITYHHFSQTLRHHIENKLIAISDGRQAELRERLNAISTFVAERGTGPTPIRALEELTASLKAFGAQSEEYKQRDASYRGLFQRYLDMNLSMYDMLLVSREGDVVFSLKHESDFGANLNSPALKDTNLARLVDSVHTFLNVGISDYDFYPPSGRHALFVAAPVFGESRHLGTIVFQMEAKMLSEFAQNYTGLPSTGEIVLGKRVGHEIVLTMPTRFKADAAFQLKVKIDTASCLRSCASLQKAVLGETGLGFSTDYRGQKVLARWQYVPELNWGMVVKVDASEALAPVRALGIITAGVAMLMAFGIAFIAARFSRFIAEPILRLKEGSEIIGSGNLDHRVGLRLDNEIGDLSLAFDRMTENLKKTTASKQALEREVTERKRTEAALRRVNHFQAAIMAHAGAAIIATTPEGIITTFNTAAEKMLGYRAEEVVGKVTPELIHDPDEVRKRAELFSRELNATVRPGFEVMVAKAQRNLPNTYEWTYRRKDGSSFPVLLSVTALRNEQGDITGFLGVATDMTERKQDEERISKLLQAVEQSSATIVITDTRGAIEYVNPAFEKISGYTLEEAIGQNPRILKSGEQTVQFYRNLWETISSGKIWYGEFHNRKKSGELYWESASIAPIKNPEGKITHFVAVKEDISERKKREEELRQLSYELERSNHELNDFAYVVSHDLKAPLRGIASLATWLEADFAEKLGEEGRKQVRLLKERSIQMDQLINGILEYSRIGRVKEQEEKVDLNDLAREAIALLGVPSHIKVTFANALPTLRCQRVRIQQVFQNLLSNAVHYMDKEEGRIILSCCEREKEWEFCVEDNGPGIDEKHFGRIFKLFQTIPVQGKASGTGIGLSLIKKAVELHGGRIWLESRVGQGSRFYFTLPKSF
ncbi:MAG: PAS domain S-box protein [Candidatus Omnitrophota bacterium]